MVQAEGGMSREWFAIGSVIGVGILALWIGCGRVAKPESTRIVREFCGVVKGAQYREMDWQTYTILTTSKGVYPLRGMKQVGFGDALWLVSRERTWRRGPSSHETAWDRKRHEVTVTKGYRGDGS